MSLPARPVQRSLLLLLASLALSCTADSSFSGYIKSFALLQSELDNPVLKQPTVAQSQNAGRIMWESFNDSTISQVHYEISPVLTSRNQPVDSPTFNIVSGNYRLTDIKTSLSESDDKNQVFQNLDRLNVQWRFDHGDLTVGRQAIAMGSARAINPTDVFVPFDVRTFNTEYRVGVDAIRYQKPVGQLGELDIGVVLGKDADPANSAAFLQVRGNTAGSDLQLALMRFAEQNLIGGGIQTALGDVGFWFEAAMVSGDDDYLRLSTGIDYAFTESLFAMIEYHHNGIGEQDPARYLTQFDKVAYQKGGVFLLGRDYLIPSLSYQISAIWTLNVQALVNLSDQSVFSSLLATRSLTDNLYADAGIYLFSGDDLVISASGQPQLGSEYGANPNILFASLRWYF